MKSISLVIAAVLAGSFMLPAQLPNPLNLPDPLGITRSNPKPPVPDPGYQEQRPQEGRKVYKRHYQKRYPKHPNWKRRRRGH